jgi:hypothetical protein
MNNRLAVVSLCSVLFITSALPAFAQSTETPEEEEQRIRRLGDVDPSVEEWTPGQIAVELEVEGNDLDGLQAQAEEALAAGQLAGSEGAVVLWLEVLTRGGNDTRAREALDETRQRWLVTINRQLNNANRAALLAEQQQLNQLGEVAALDSVRQRLRQALSWLEARPGQNNIASPDAWQTTHEQLTTLRQEAGPLDWIDADLAGLREQLLQRWEARDLSQASSLLQWVDLADAYAIDLPERAAVLPELQRLETEQLEAAVLAAIESNDLTLAAQRLSALDETSETYEDLKLRIERATYLARLEPGDEVDVGDGDVVHEMVVVWREDDGRIFVVGKTEVTRQQFQTYLMLNRLQPPEVGSDRFEVRDGELVADQMNPGQDYLGRDSAAPDYPAIHVRWQDANAYADWLSESSGIRFSLPSAVEYERYAGAGIDGRFWWGDNAPFQALENLAGRGDVSPRRQRHSDAFEDYSDDAFGPSEVAQYRANPLGLYDTLGNVAEWSLECGDQSDSGCQAYVALGPHWQSGPSTSGKSAKSILPVGFASSRIGFRLVAELTP